ncbi:hypothetical protein JYU16_01365, partial [bacterium AH-315-M05]|nr:hypothetical protein [bacterium AH-315-M05]
MKTVFILSLLAVFALFNKETRAQCAYDNTIFLTWTAPPNIGDSVFTTCTYSGEYNRVNGMTAGYKYRIYTCGDTDFDTQLTIYPAGGGADQAYNDDFCGPLQSQIDFVPATSGNYDILLDRFFCINDNAPPCMTMIVKRIGPPNDLCANAIPVTCGSVTSGNTEFASTESVPVCVVSSTSPGVWYTVIGTGGPMIAETCTGTAYDSKISVYTGSCGVFSCVTGDDDDCGLQSRVQWNSTLGTTYFILVHGFGGASGPFDLTIRTGMTNETCATAIIVTAGTFTGNTVCTSNDAAPFCGTSNGTGGGVWYRYTGTGDFVTATLCAGTSYDSKIRVYTGTCGSLVCETGNDDFGGCGLQSQVSWCSVSGTTYHILIHGFSSNEGSFTMTISETPVTTPTITAGGPTSFCVGGSVTLTSSAASSYSWSTGAITQSIVVTTGGSYTVTTTDGNGCVRTSAPTTVTVNPNPSNDNCAGATLITAGTFTGSTLSTSPNCATSDVAPFCGTGDGTGGGVWYRYTGIGDFVTATLCAGTSYDSKIRVYTGTCGSLVCETGNDDFGGCGLQSQVSWCSLSGTDYYILIHGFSSNEGSFTLTISETPIAIPTITASGPTTFCVGGSVTLTSSAAVSYLWSPGGETTQSIVVTTSGGYQVTTTDANGCVRSSAFTAVTVNPNPTPTITASGPTTFCQGSSVTLTSSASVSYLWSTGATTQSIVVTTSGSYTVTVTDGNGCSGTSAPTTVTVN